MTTDELIELLKDADPELSCEIRISRNGLYGPWGHIEEVSRYGKSVLEIEVTIK